jgi:hypothetical protein
LRITRRRALGAVAGAAASIGGLTLPTLARAANACTYGVITGSCANGYGVWKWDGTNSVTGYTTSPNGSYYGAYACAVCTCHCYRARITVCNNGHCHKWCETVYCA